MTDNPFHDPEREHLARTGEVLRRVDACAADSDCPNDARPGRAFCSDACADDSWLRSERRWVGGGLCANSELDEEQVGGTRFPQENSRRGDGYA